MRILVTGARGFAGKHLLAFLASAGHEVVGATRGEPPGEGNWISLPEDADWVERLAGFGAIVHAGGATPSNVSAGSGYEESKAWTTRLAESLRAHPEIAVVHLSSLSATGSRERLASGVVDDSWDSRPSSEYGHAKQEMEETLDAVGQGRLVVHLRPPLIHGKGATGPWAKLLGILRLPIPLPFGSVRNRRSYLSVDHLGAAVAAILEKASETTLSGVYHLADDPAVSLRDIGRELRKASGRSPALFPFPVAVMKTAMKAIGKSDLAAALFGDLVVDSSRFRHTFAWEPERSTLAAMMESIGTSRNLPD